MERIIMHVDMDAFFASVEQRCNPRLRGRPIGVVGSAKRTVITTASYEARGRGVKTGMNKYEALRACPELILVTGNNPKYIDTSCRIIEILGSFSPQVEPYSIDEAFLELSGKINDNTGGNTHSNMGSNRGGNIVPTRGTTGGATASPAPPTPEEVGVAIKKRIQETLGLTCSVGIGPNKLLSKLASGMKKPSGLVRIRPEDVPLLLDEMPAGKLWGIGPRLTEDLKAMGVSTCGELARTPASLLRNRFGITGERLSLMAQGIDTAPVVPIGSEEEIKSIGHSTTLPRDISGREEMAAYILRLSEMVARRARRGRLMGRRVCLTIRYSDFHTFSRYGQLPAPTNDTRSIYARALKILGAIDMASPVRLLGVSISGLVKDRLQGEIFDKDRQRRRLMEALDEVNDRFGDFTISVAPVVVEQREPGVISPAWRPKGVRRVNVR